MPTDGVTPVPVLVAAPVPAPVPVAPPVSEPAPVPVPVPVPETETVSLSGSTTTLPGRFSPGPLQAAMTIARTTTASNPVILSRGDFIAVLPFLQEWLSNFYDATPHTPASQVIARPTGA